MRDSTEIHKLFTFCPFTPSYLSVDFLRTRIVSYITTVQLAHLEHVALIHYCSLSHSPYLHVVGCLNALCSCCLHSLYHFPRPGTLIAFIYYVLVCFNLEHFLSLSLSFWTSIFLKSPGQLFCSMWCPIILSCLLVFYSKEGPSLLLCLHQYELIDSYFIHWVIIPFYHYFDFELCQICPKGTSSSQFLCLLDMYHSWSTSILSGTTRCSKLPVKFCLA